VLVIGAGVVGMACARALRSAGHRVIVADPLPPGTACSFGNAGVIATEHVLPMARFDVLRRVPGMLLDPTAPLYLRAHRVPGLLPWFARFAAAARPARVRLGTRAIAALTGRALPAWQRLLGNDGAFLLRRSGMYTVYRSERSFDRDADERELASRFGIPWQALDADSLRAREPALSPMLTRAVYYPEVAHVIDPHAVVDHLATAFVAAGGQRLDVAVTGLVPLGDAVQAQTAAGAITAGHVVIAAGLGARDLCRGLGFTMPLAAEMGYHVGMAGAGQRLRAPVSSAEGGFIITPMGAQGDALRAAGTVEFAWREAPPAWHRADSVWRQASSLFREPLPAPTSRWRGSRPTLPDFLPAIGALPGLPRVLAAFGHQHIGLTTAAVTAEAVVALLAGHVPDLDLTPFDPGRFRWRRRA
jgi:glycine/D-amino acid oxidase-like deaminating enzyme